MEKSLMTTTTMIYLTSDIPVK